MPGITDILRLPNAALIAHLRELLGLGRRRPSGLARSLQFGSVWWNTRWRADRPAPLHDSPAPFGAHDRDPVLVEVGGNHQGLRDLVEAVLAQAIEDGLALDAVIVGSEAQRRSIWRIREAIPEAIGRLGWIITHDVSVPLSRIAGFAEELEQGLVRLAPRCRLAIYGHLGDRNLHVSVLPPVGDMLGEQKVYATELSGFMLSAVSPCAGRSAPSMASAKTRHNGCKRPSLLKNST